MFIELESWKPIELIARWHAIINEISICREFKWINKKFTRWWTYLTFHPRDDELFEINFYLFDIHELLETV